MLTFLHLPSSVVSLAGTWIETCGTRRAQRDPDTSFPSRERGLKLNKHSGDLIVVFVVSLAGTWIETEKSR